MKHVFLQVDTLNSAHGMVFIIPLQSIDICYGKVYFEIVAIYNLISPYPGWEFRRIGYAAYETLCMIDRHRGRESRYCKQHRGLAYRSVFPIALMFGSIVKR